jgi:glycosyltransferase involved in cell wall biosynthesis
MATLEAAACGLPIVGPPVGVLPELPGVEIVAGDTPRTLADGIVRLWRDPAREARAAATRRFVEREYSSVHTARIVSSLYSSAAVLDPARPLSVRAASARASEPLS